MGAGFAAPRQTPLARAGGKRSPRRSCPNTTRPATCARATSARWAVQNPVYTGTYVFDNDFPALLLPEAGGSPDAARLFVAEEESRHLPGDLLLSAPRSVFAADGPCRTSKRVVAPGAEQTRELGRLDYIRYVQIFENKGAMMGASNPHPHSQVWATGHIPNEPALELPRQDGYLAEHGSCLLCDYVAAERQNGERVMVPTSTSLPWCPSGRSGRLNYAGGQHPRCILDRSHRCSGRRPGGYPATGCDRAL